MRKILSLTMLAALFGALLFSALPRTAVSARDLRQDGETPTETPTDAPTETATPTATNTPLPTATNTPLPTSTNTPLPTATSTPLPTATNTPLPTATNTPLPTATNTALPTATNTPLPTPTNTALPTATNTPRPTATNTPRPTATNTPTPTPLPPRIDLNGSSAGTGYTTSYIAGSPPIKAAGEVALTVPRGALLSATVRIQNLRDGAAEALDANVAGTGLSKSYSAGVLRLQGSASRAVYETVLRSVTYRNNAAVPDTADRKIDFTVNDGFADSNTAVSTIRILFLRLELDVSPATQTIASGGTAVFTVAVRNSGSVTLNTVPLRSDADDDCDRTWNSITPGTTRRISCSATGVTADLINRFTVTGTAGGSETSAAASARVEVDNPNIRIVKSPSTQTVLAGEQAQFNIFVLNPSTRVNLGDVEVSDPLAPDCSREGGAGLGNLPAGEQQTYSCASAAVSTAFTNVITVTGRNLFTGAVVSDSSVAAVELLDMQPALQVDPALLSAPGGPVTFALTAVNSGSRPWTLTALENADLGDLLDPDNAAARDNTCAALPSAAVATGEQLSCTFTATITGPAGPQRVTLALTVEDDDELALSMDASATITIGEEALLETALSAATDSAPPDGRFVREQLTLHNLSQAEVVTVTVLDHSARGSLDGVGTCSLPQTIPPGGRYVCGYENFISGAPGDEIVHTVRARGSSGAAGVAGEASWIYTIFDPALRRDWLPVVASGYSQPVEENDSACTAFRIAPNATYTFMLDDAEDWYHLWVRHAGTLTVELRNFVSADPQLTVYQGPCSSLNDGIIAFDGSRRTDKTLQFAAAPGHYFVRVLNAAPEPYNVPYTLFVGTP